MLGNKYIPNRKKGTFRAIFMNPIDTKYEKKICLLAKLHHSKIS